MIDIKTLKQLIKLMRENDLSEIDLKDQDEQVTLKRGAGGQIIATPTAVSMAPLPLPPAAGEALPAHAEDDGLVEIQSPMVGTFYSAPSPDANPFVSVGSVVGPDTIVCLIEAMKVFNEIKAETSGRIVRVLVKNAEAVEFDQPLFDLTPA